MIQAGQDGRTALSSPVVEYESWNMNVYILTETGKGYNDAGIREVLARLKEYGADYDTDISGITIDSGPDLNQPKDFANLLKTQTAPWVVLSTEEEIFYAPPVMKDEFIRLLSQDDKGYTSWEILTTAIKEHGKQS